MISLKLKRIQTKLTRIVQQKRTRLTSKVSGGFL